MPLTRGISTTKYLNLLGSTARSAAPIKKGKNAGMLYIIWASPHFHLFVHRNNFRPS